MLKQRKIDFWYKFVDTDRKNLLKLRNKNCILSTDNSTTAWKFQNF